MIKTIYNHRTIRKFKNLKIDDDVLNSIIEAGTRASTTGNMQLYSIIVTKDEINKSKLWEYHFKQNMVLQAPVILTFCADFNRFNKWCKLRNADAGYNNFLSFYTASIDALIAAQNVALGAEDKGLGICYLGTTTYMAKNIIDLLHLPVNVVPVTTLVIGYPDEDPGLTDRLPVSSIVHIEKYQDYSDEDIEGIYREKESLQVNQEFVKTNKKENLAQIFTDIRYTKKDNVEFSKRFLEVIEKQNFMNH